MIEFKKRLDQDLPFFYYTSAHKRFYECTMPEFSVPASKLRKLRHAPQRELLGASHQVTLAVRGTGSIQATFHLLLVPPTSLYPNTHMLLHNDHIHNNNK